MSQPQVATLEAIKREERLNLLMYADLLAFPARREDGLGALGCYVVNGQLSITQHSLVLFGVAAPNVFPLAGP